jgi:hypothetical protein
MDRIVTLMKNEKNFSIVCIGLIFLLLLLLGFDLAGGSAMGDGAVGVVGKTILKRNDVRRKFSGQAVWAGLDRGASVMNRDTIMTGRDSGTAIELNDGTVVDLGEDALVVMEFSEDMVRLDLKEGRLNVRKSADGKDGEPLSITAGGKKIVLESGEVNVASREGEDPLVYVENSTARVVVDGAKKSLDPGERIRFQVGPGSDVDTRKIVLKYPENNRRYTAAAVMTNVKFSWDAGGKGAGNGEFVFELGNNMDFSPVFRRLTLRETVTGISMPEGNYYWRVRLAGGEPGTPVSSETRTFSVTRDSPIRLYSPANGETLEYSVNPPLVAFTWESGRLASQYVLEISESEDFSRPLKKFESRTDNFSYQWERDMKPGSSRTYYWRVKAGNRALKWTGITSATSSFKIKKSGELSPPVLVTPADNSKISRFHVEKDTVVFSWEKAERGLRRKISFSRSSNFDSIYKEISTDSNYWVMSRSFPVGKYYWRVGLFDDEHNKTAFSGTRSFESLEVDRPTLVSPYQNAEIEMTDLHDGGLRFTWKRLDINGKFILEISGNKEFSSIHDSVTTKACTAVMANLDPGRYYWRVRLLDGANKPLSVSDTRDFDIRDLLPTPVPVFPVAGKKIEISSINEFDFKWKPVREANSYSIELHQFVTKGGKTRDRLLMARDTGSMNYTLGDMSVLDSGNFYWTLKATKKNQRGRVVRTSRTVRNRFNVDLGGSKIKIISPEFQVVPDE